MAILSIILGVIMTIFGISLMFTSFATFLAAGFIIGIMLFAYGIISLIRSIQQRAGVPAYVRETITA